MARSNTRCSMRTPHHRISWCTLPGQPGDLLHSRRWAPIFRNLTIGFISSCVFGTYCLLLAFLLSFFRCGPSELSLSGARLSHGVQLAGLGHAPVVFAVCRFRNLVFGFLLFHHKHNFTIAILGNSLDYATIILFSSCPSFILSHIGGYWTQPHQSQLADWT